MDSARNIGATDGALKHLSNTHSLSHASLPHLPKDFTKDTETSSSLIPNSTIQNLISMGRPQEALAISLANSQAMQALYGIDHQFSLNSLTNLLEHSVLANNSEFVSYSQIEHLQSCAINPELSVGNLRMRVLSRLCEFSARFSKESEYLRTIASETLKCLHSCYPIADISPELKRYCARASFVAASHMVDLTMREERPDFRDLDDMASCAHQRLAVFDQELSDFYMGLYKLRRGEVDQALKIFDQVASDSSRANIELIVTALEAPIPKLFEEKRLIEALERVMNLSTKLNQNENATSFPKVMARIAIYRRKLGLD